MSQAKGILLAFLAGAALAFGIDWARHDARIDRLKATSDSVVAVQAAKDSAAKVFTDSMTRVVAGLEARKTVIVTKVRADEATVAALDTALATAATLADSNAVLTEQVATLKEANLGLWSALAKADSATAAATARGNTLQARVNDLNASIAVLAHQINGLRAGPPKWVRVSLEVVKLGGAAYAGYQVGKKSR